MGLFKRRERTGGADGPAHRLYFATDIHGAEVLWRKFLSAGAAYDARTLIMGGDVTGKVVIPIVATDEGWRADLYGDVQTATGEDQLKALEDRIRNSGLYPHRMTDEQVAEVGRMDEQRREAWFAEVMLVTFRRWLALAEERLEDGVRCFMMPGNDDPAGIDGAIEEATRVEACDDRIVEFGDYRMISLGYANRTPFDSPRELEEDEIYARVSRLADQVEDRDRLILNLHVPPHDSQLDIAPALDADLNVVMSGSEPKLVPVGSTAVRELIETYQPLLSLHGHVHESPGATKIGRTLAINPGSDYHTGRIAGCLVTLAPDRVRHQFVTG
ncbi:MAG: hypothetical protein WC558_00565 [Patulibacter sp.]